MLIRDRVLTPKEMREELVSVLGEEYVREVEERQGFRFDDETNPRNL